MSESGPMLGNSLRRLLPAFVLLWPTALTAGDETHPRHVAVWGPEPARTVWEPAIGVGPSGPVIVFNVGPRTSAAVGYAIYAPGEWIEGLIEPAPNRIDPSAARDPLAGDFLVTGMPITGTQIVAARVPGDPYPTWTPIYTSDTPVDKPWVVAGETTKHGPEFYVVAWNTVEHTYTYQRTRDGGRTWNGGRILLSRDPTRIVAGTWCAQPAAVTEQDGPLYVAYAHENHAYGSAPEDPEACRGARLRFLRGNDIDDPKDPCDGAVEFEPLCEHQRPRGFGPSVQPVILEIALTCGGIKNFIPLRRGVSQFGQKLDRFVPHLIVDPSDTSRLYVVYHDVREQHGRPTADVNVYLHTLTQRNGGWVLGPRRQVNQNTDNMSDQFLPAATVDDHGRIHAVFYDDRSYDQDDGQPGSSDPDPRFDVYYAVSDDQGQSWRERKLILGPVDESAVDLGLSPLSPGFELGEYVDIAWYAGPGGETEVWTAFTGTLSSDTAPPGSDKSVVYYSRHTHERRRPEGVARPARHTDPVPAP